MRLVTCFRREILNYYVQSWDELIANPEIILAMRERLLEERDAWSWDRYGARWAKILQDVAGKI